MAAGNVILDTCAVIEQFKQNESLEKLLETAEKFHIPIPVLGELRYGADRSPRPENKHAQIDKYVLEVKVLPTDSETAVQYGRIKSILANNGTPIPENDIWIAAIAVQHGMTVITTDVHFDQVPDLDTKAW